MEKGVVFDIKRFAVNDGPGIRSVVFLKGCPLRCKWCHNPEGIKKEIEISPKTIKVEGKSYIQQQNIGYEISSTELVDEIMKDRIFMEDSGGGVTFSGGEPFLQHKFLLETLQQLRCKGIHTAVDTSGFCSWEIIEKVIPFVSLFLYDLKCIDKDNHLLKTGYQNDLILDNIKKLSNSGIPFHVRIPVIPTLNYTKKDIAQIASFIAPLQNIAQVDLLPYHKVAQNKYERLGLKNELFDEPSVDPDDLLQLIPLFEHLNVRVTIGG